MTTRRISVFLIVIGLTAQFVQAGQIQELPEPKIVKQMGQCALVQAGPVRVLLLQGTPYQMGYAHGQLVASDVQSTIMRVALVAQASDIAKKKAPGSTLAEIYKRTLPYVPVRFREEVAGLADGAGINRGMAELTICPLWKGHEGRQVDPRPAVGLHGGLGPAELRDRNRVPANGR